MSDIKTFEQFCKDVLGVTKIEKIEENRHSLSRFVMHMLNDPFVILMSTERSPYEAGKEVHPDWDYSNPENLEKARKIGAELNAVQTASFRDALKARNIGFIPAKGSYVETHIVDGKKKEIQVIENTTIIYVTEHNKQDIFEYCCHWAKEYDQECILLASGGKGYFYYIDSGRIEDRGVFYPEKIGDFWTELAKENKNAHRNGRSFTFTDDPSKISATLKRVFKLKDE